MACMDAVPHFEGSAMTRDTQLETGLCEADGSQGFKMGTNKQDPACAKGRS